ncbi:MAG: RNA polymerase sigma factor [Bacteroidales bacterium]
MKTIKSDNQLWVLIAAGDEGAFSVVFDRYFHSLAKYAYTIVNKTEVAEDIVSEVFVKLWLSRMEIQIKTSLKSYLFVSARNKALNHRRDEVRKCELEELSEQEALSSESADHQLTQAEVLEEFQQILHTLSPQQRIILQLQKIDGLSQAEVAERLSISIKTVQNHTSLALKQVAEGMALKRFNLQLLLVLFLAC